MSFDRLQKAIRAKKCPVALTLGTAPDGVPPQFAEAAQAKLGPGRQARADALLRFSLGLLDALGDLVPAVILRVPHWEALGWQGLQALERVSWYAREKGLFVIADARRGDAGDAAAAYGQAWLDKSGFSADCLTVSAYQGSDALVPLLERCRAEDRCLLALVHTANPSAREVQDLIAGDRLVCQVLGDLVRRLGREDVGEMGYSRLGAVVGTPWPSDLRALRKRLEGVFFLLSAGDEGECALDDARFAFDGYGRGALIAYGGPVLAWKSSGGGGADCVDAARAALTQARDAVKQYVTLL